MATVNITLTPFQPAEFDLDGFHGKGCSEIADLFARLGETVERSPKPESHQVRLNTAARQQQRSQTHVGGRPGPRRR